MALLDPGAVASAVFGGIGRPFQQGPLGFPLKTSDRQAKPPIAEVTPA
tara:strand:- start:59 stop:202 length:144 start_codon:yes stop_codon:yes gene_type:complete